MPNRGMIPETGTVVLRPLGEGENTAPVFVRVGRASAPSPSLARPGGQRGEGVREHVHNSDEPQRMHIVHPLGGSSKLRTEARPTWHSWCHEGSSRGGGNYSYLYAKGAI